MNTASWTAEVEEVAAYIHEAREMARSEGWDVSAMVSRELEHVATLYGAKAAAYLAQLTVTMTVNEAGL